MTALSRRLLGIAALFLAVQAAIIWSDVNGPFVDESLYIVIGLRVLEGHGPADGYAAWVNGSPYVWPVVAALGHHAGELAGARFAAALLSSVTLLAFGATAAALVGPGAAVWATAALGANGLFMALAHFAVYDVAALTFLAVAMWCVTRGTARAWVVAGAVAFALAVIAKYGYAFMLVPLLGLLAATRGRTSALRAVAVFIGVAGVILLAYVWLTFGSLVPTSSGTYFSLAFGRTRAHIGMLQVVFGIVPLALATGGAVLAWRSGRRLLVLTCLAAACVYPAFHLWTANFVSGQKHVVAGFLFVYVLAGLTLERLWRGRARATAVALLGLVTAWGVAQCYWQDRSWSDTRALAQHLVRHLAPGDRVIAESSWNYVLALYPRGLIASPADVIDANHTPTGHRPDVCGIRWLIGNPEGADTIRDALARCGHTPVRASTSRHYYVDTSRLRVGTYPATVTLYRRPAS